MSEIAGQPAPMLVSRLTLSGLEFIHRAKSAAASGCSEPRSTAVADPPSHAAETVSPAFHCGISPTAQLPAVSGAVPRTMASAQEPEIQVTISPLCRSAFHSLEKSATTLTRSSSIMRCQNSATARVSSPSMLTTQESPSVVNHWAPRC